MDKDSLEKKKQLKIIKRKMYQSSKITTSNKRSAKRFFF